MNELDFVWDNAKSSLNKKKHGVSFEEAKSVFWDENAIEFFDEGHSNEEDRFILLGISYALRILVVCHCIKNKGHTIRIISARKATRKEKQYYQGDSL